MSLGVICIIYVVGIALLFIELFMPGMIMAMLGTTAVIVSIYLAFVHQPAIYGIVLVVVALILIPSIIVWMLRKITLKSAQNLEEGYTSVDESLEDLKGKEGIAVTILRPSGVAKIEGHRIDVTSETTVIEKDTPIKVIKVESNRVIVKAIGSPQKAE